MDRTRLSGHARVLWARFFEGAPEEDERSRHARTSGALMLLGAASGIILLPLLPARIDHRLALGIGLTALVAGAVMPFLPWHRWPRMALLAPEVLVLPMLFIGGGLIDGSVDYYSLFLPLAFIYMGLAFPPMYCVWLLVCSLAGLWLSMLHTQPPGAVPFVLLNSLLSAVCGLVLAFQRRTEARSQQAMSKLVESATYLGAASDREDVARIVAAAAAELLDADGVEVLILGVVGGGSFAHASFGSPLPDVGVHPLGPDQRMAELATAAAHGTSLPTEPATNGDGPAGGGRIVFPIRGPGQAEGAILVSYQNIQHARNRVTTRTVSLLAAEAGRVLDRLHLTSQLVASARTDPLTGLGNRSVLQEALDASTTGDAVILLDLDHFKRVNDTLGHAAGDEVLISFADVLRRTARPGQTVARYGGEEFVVILPRLDERALTRHLAAMRAEWAAKKTLVTYSSGIAIRTQDEHSSETLARADRALYRAKNEGRNRDLQDVGTVTLTRGS